MIVKVEGYDAKKDKEFVFTIKAVDLVTIEHETDDGVYVNLEGGEIHVHQKIFQIENVP